MSDFLDSTLFDGEDYPRTGLDLPPVHAARYPVEGYTSPRTTLHGVEIPVTQSGLY